MSRLDSSPDFRPLSHELSPSSKRSRRWFYAGRVLYRNWRAPVSETRSFIWSSTSRSLPSSSMSYVSGLIVSKLPFLAILHDLTVSGVGTCPTLFAPRLYRLQHTCFHHQYRDRERQFNVSLTSVLNRIHGRCFFWVHILKMVSMAWCWKPWSPMAKTTISKRPSGCRILLFSKLKMA